MPKKLYLFFLFIFLLALDQLLKFLVLAYQPLPSIVCNKNIAWSISLRAFVFYPFWIIIFIFLAYLFARSSRLLEKILLLIIFAGAISNILDRLTRGCVVDFINLKLFPVFNLADIYITIGILLLVIIYIKQKILNTKY